jgi:RNA polymerase sigma factor (sigma-70 family)
MLAAAKSLKSPYLVPPRDDESGTPRHNSSFLSAMESPDQATQSNLELMFRDHGERVFRVAHRVTGSAADAEDVLQTVFLRLVRTRDSQSETFSEWSEKPEAYLSRAAINASLDLLRKRKRSKAVAFDDLEQSAAMSSTSATSTSVKRNPESHHEDRELRKLIREAVARLGENAGAMFALRYFEGYDNGEIARIMGTSPLVVGVTLHRARARLRKEIGKYLRGAKG